MTSLCVGLVALALAATPSSVDELQLKDQLGRADSLAAHRGEVVVAFVVTARRLRRIKAWEQALRAQYDDVHYLRVADVPDTGSATYEDIAEKLRRRVPEEVSTLIDLDRAWATTFELDTTQPNLLIFDSKGALQERFRGYYDDNSLQTVREALDHLIDTK